MDHSRLLLSAMLLRGRFDKMKIYKSKFRAYTNHLLAFIQSFWGLKILIVLVMPWDEQVLLFYLIDFYFFPSGKQNALFFAMVFIHLHLAYIRKWAHLSAKAEQMYHLKMFFMPDLKRLSVDTMICQ